MGRPQVRYSVAWPPHPPLSFPYPLHSTDVFSEFHIPLASDAHHAVLDLIAACHGPRDTRVLALRLNGATQEDIAYELGIWQSSVSRRLDRVMETAYFEDLALRFHPRALAMETTATPTKLRHPKHEGPVAIDEKGEPLRNRHGGLRRRRLRRDHSNCWCAKKVTA